MATAEPAPPFARIGFDLRKRDGTPAVPGDLHDIRQQLDLWSGTRVSRFRLEDRALQVWTWVHPGRDLLAVRFEAPGWESGHCAVRIAFPYGAPVHTGDPADWTLPDRPLSLSTSDASFTGRCRR